MHHINIGDVFGIDICVELLSVYSIAILPTHNNPAHTAILNTHNNPTHIAILDT